MMVKFCLLIAQADGVGKYMCQKCHSSIDGEPLRFRGEVYHPYHFNCTGKVLYILIVQVVVVIAIANNQKSILIPVNI